MSSVALLLQKPALKCMAELDAVKPRKCRNYFRTLVSIFTAAYKQGNFTVVDKAIKQFDEQIIISAEKNFMLFCQSLQGYHRKPQVEKAAQ